jgi:hypothetical protein
VNGARAVALIVYSLILVGRAPATPVSDNCTLPPGLGEQVSRKYAGTRLVSLADLSEDDRNFFRKDHGTQCPGLVSVDFYGDGKPTWALVLIAGSKSKRKESLVVARKAGEIWEIQLLDTAGGAVPVVWKQGPGEYEDVYGNKKIRAPRSVVVLCGYESWAILYAWTGKRVENIWIAD